MSAAPGTPVNSEARAALPSSPASDKVNAYLDIAGQHAPALFCFKAVKQAGLEPAKKKSKNFLKNRLIRFFSSDRVEP
jgi:hypothetical protein